MATKKTSLEIAAVQKHQQLYKGRTPPWKDTYRKRCFDRLKRSRDKNLGKFRKLDLEENEDPSKSMVPSLMVEEWKNLQQEDQGLPSLRAGSVDDLMFENCEDESIDDMLSVFEEIREELLKEEQRLLEEYEYGIVCDEEVLNATIETLQADDIVVCPICSKNQLLENKGVFFCKCGVRIDTEQDCVSLKDIRRSLQEGCEQHAESCCSLPQFSVINQIGVDNLIISCQICDFMFIVV